MTFTTPPPEKKSSWCRFFSPSWVKHCYNLPFIQQRGTSNFDIPPQYRVNSINLRFPCIREVLFSGWDPDLYASQRAQSEFTVHLSGSDYPKLSQLIAAYFSLSQLILHCRIGVSKNRGTPKWMVLVENPISMDDLGVPRRSLMRSP